ncbi:MAG: acyl carrier protein [Candidatus Nephrothrix sp. EaCA]|nr:MAG: acyl carrier protein [Candidatus Nephrothrix sp. EaCA]
MQDVNAEIVSLLKEKLGVPESVLTSDASLEKDLGIDSLDYAEIIMELEQQFNIRIPDKDIRKIETIGQAAEYVKMKLD